MIRKTIRFVHALLVTPVIWGVAAPASLFCDYLHGNGYDTTRDLLKNHADSLAFKD